MRPPLLALLVLAACGPAAPATGTATVVLTVDGLD
jgi:hypothetical protein